MNPPKYTYVVGQKYWYFRRAGLLEALDGAPGDAVFEETYAASAAKAEARLAARARDKDRRARNARDRRSAVEREVLGAVYFIGGKIGPVKIGFTTDLSERLLRLQMNSPKRLRVLASYPGTRRDEMMLHRKHEGTRLHGEWFKRTAALKDDIVAARSAGTDAAQKAKLLTAQDSCAKSFRSQVL